MARILPIADTKWGFPFFAPNNKLPSPFLNQLTIDHEIAPGMLFHDCLVEIATAHRQHPEGARYSCYGSWIGTGLIWMFYPLESAEGMKQVLSDKEALTAAKGQKESDKLLATYQTTLIATNSKILTYRSELSNPKSNLPEDTPFEYLYYIEAKLNAKAHTPEYKSAFDAYVKTNNDNKHGLHWVCYSESTAPDKLHVFIPMRKFGAMDEWEQLDPLTHQLIHQDATSDRAFLYSGIETYKSSLMTFVPSCDNSGCEFIED